jgi:ubiquinone/menaquinone biosynthesis C-methylase UbiE
MQTVQRRPGRYQVEAAIAALHDDAASAEETDWPQILDMHVGAAGQRVVDMGTGTGAVARGFARRGCVVTGLDPARAMLDQARRLDAEAGLSVTYRVGNAEATGLGSGCWDVVAAGQCWHWFERPRAAAEARRLLVPGGALVICHMDYLPLAGNVCAASEALILEHNPSWAMAGGTGIHADWTLDAAGAGFTGIQTFSDGFPRHSLELSAGG